MILFEEVAPGDFYTRIGMIIVGGLIFLQGVRIRCSNPPKFVANYRGWSSPELALPFGGVFVFTLRVGAFRPPVPRRCQVVEATSSFWKASRGVR